MRLTLLALCLVLAGCKEDKNPPPANISGVSGAPGAYSFGPDGAAIPPARSFGDLAAPSNVQVQVKPEPEPRVPPMLSLPLPLPTPVKVPDDSNLIVYLMAAIAIVFSIHRKTK